MLYYGAVTTTIQRFLGTAAVSLAFVLVAGVRTGAADLDVDLIDDGGANGSCLFN